MGDVESELKALLVKLQEKGVIDENDVGDIMNYSDQIASYLRGG